ncbi:AAEL012870-PA [Aedes aegypti]|uniref:AAEL012870-PA n=2 Tax=Aedes aegypti TaxID=7159 RepID=A0A1S4FXD1_AEDAE|nr:uncharacterized protein LOC5576922 [Aedes aegypti]4FD7_A Chain A, putative arylalkylamine N-Acetyltransferase 7 [Aedes aegypti]4FD7_B Chain B, putative arylalkylamine N-Acetyltransferase 7 [Aedes aegypti]4FD7_C Chain C, putative arylalkylamine N-Acetyltransferase 7 [Aedes aegypti]4FD7_D Chain D, putative arylalkylamine N-Acetyltransferase 7 [Aedes aegypti]EAT34939.1 AAEL012870-PA [Aedes aegypti]
MKWTRSVKVPFPSVWHRFQAKDLTSQQLVWYRVQDLPEDRFEDAIRHMCDYFARDELMNQAKGLAKDLVAMGDVVALWKAMLPDRMSLVCFREGSDEIVGVNILDVASRSDKDNAQFNSAIFQAIYDTIEYVSHQANIFDRYNVDHYLNAMGLSVDPKYRGRGIATEILRARIPLCRAVGLKLSATCFTGPNSQTAATRVGFQEDFTITYGELARVDQRFNYPGIEENFCKYMSLRVD